VTAAVVVEVLDQRAARRLVSDARNALAVADDVLARLYAGRAWEALGHADWSALCAAELPELRHLKLRAGPRRARVAALLAAAPDATVRDVVAVTGASLGTAHADLAAVRGSGAAPAAVEHRAAHVIVTEVVTVAGARGLTIPQVQRRLGWTYGATSGALSRAERRGLLHRPADLDPRGGFRPYVAR
jgi:hypothetical protein